jgi:hypothetical protein
MGLWLDGADSSTVTTANGSVSQWNDKSGNGRNLTQGTTSNKPSHSTSTGLVTFDGGDRMFVAANVFGTGSPAYTYGIVFHRGASGGGIMFWAGIGGGNRDNFADFSGTGTGNGWFSNDLGASITIGANSTHLVVGRYDGSSSHSIWVDGPSSATGSRTASGMNLQNDLMFYIGAADDFGSPLTGGIGEMICTTADSDTTQRQKIEGYLAWKWGLTSSLYAGHPYKSAAPTL